MSGSSGVDTLAAQLLYGYVLRSGDFDGNGYIDVLVDRQTPGEVDGSLQTVILYQSSTGITPVIPSSTELNNARTFPVDAG